jgi:membrane protease YdiL (CAAX protease family)
MRYSKKLTNNLSRGRPAILNTVEAQPVVDGRRLLGTIAAALAAGVAIGSATFLALRSEADSSVTGQVITLEVYACLVASFAFAFRPTRNPPLAFRYPGASDLGLAFLTWLGVMATAFVLYLALTPLTGNPLEALRKVLAVATDAKRLQGKPLIAWCVAIPRGCLLAPVFEELFFRGLLLDWLRKGLSNGRAIAGSAVLFATMHVYPIAMPYAFLFGLFAGWLRLRTRSTVSTLFVHTLNNLLFLGLALLLLK